jgi:TonB-linked SusC/RagA family outer membrane protein
MRIKSIKFCLVAVLMTFCVLVHAQMRTITGTVMSPSGEPVIGANILVKGTARGTVTDLDGKFSLEAANTESLIISYIGNKDVEVLIGKGNDFDIAMESSTLLREVTITGAFGETYLKKASGASTQSVEGDEINRTGRENWLNALGPHIAGATVNTTSGAPGASTQIVLRGFNSLSGNNSPLIIVDGLPINNSTLDQNFLTVQNSNRNQDYTNRGADINPADIEKITVLKGPEAAALYGIEAGSGAIIITTKKGQAGKTKLTYDINTRLDQTYLFPEIQTTYGIGNLADARVRTRSAWGPKIPTGTPIYDNIGNFFQDAITTRHNATIEGGNKTITFRGSFNATNQDGTIPNTGFDRYIYRGTSTLKLPKKLGNITATYTKTNSFNDKAARGGGGFLQGLLAWPVTDDASKYLKNDTIRRRFFDDIAFAEADNPFWMVNKDEFRDETYRDNINIGININPFNWLTLTARGTYDTYDTEGYSFYHPESNTFFTENGQIEKYKYGYEGYSSVFLATARKKINKLNGALKIGTAIDDFTTNIFSERGRRLVRNLDSQYENDFSLISQSTYANSRILGRDTLRIKRLQGVFGEFTLDYDKLIFLTVAGRNDWTSTLPQQSRSFFYPSASLSFIFSDLFEKDSKTFYGKLRGSVAETAKDIQPYASQSVYALQITSGGGAGYGFTNNNKDIRPERQRTFEVGTELDFFNGRFGIDATYYNTKSLGQIVSGVRLSYGTGFILSTLNVADISNKGLELVFKANPVKSKNFQWDILVNYAKTANKVLNIPSNIPEYYNSDTWVDAFRNGLIPGGTTTTITGQDYLRNAAGQILIDPGTGNPLVDPIYRKIAERNPDFMGGIVNTLRLGNFRANLNLDVRKGGDIMNGTAYWMTLRGYSSQTLNREQYLIVPGVLRDGLEETANPTVNTMQINPFNSNFYADGRAYASNFVEKNVNWLRVREARIEYNLPKSLTAKSSYFRGASIWLAGNDLWTITNYSGADPAANSNTAATGGIGAFGVDYFSPSTPRGFSAGIRLDLTTK